MANKKSTRTGATSKRAAPKAKSQTKARQKAKQRPKSKAAPKKKPAAKRASSAKPRRTKPEAQTLQIRNLNASLNLPALSKSVSELADTRRPPNNPTLPLSIIPELIHDMNGLKEVLEAFAEHLRSLDRRRLNGVGMKKQGFIEACYRYAVETPELLPHYLSLLKFEKDGELFVGCGAIHGIGKQIVELLWNIKIVASDVWYTDALEYYSSVKEASKRRVDGTETIHNDLARFFKSRGQHNKDGEPVKTKKQTLKEADAVIEGRKNGKIIAVNVRPKLIGGVHKVIEETLDDTARYNESKEGEFRE